MDANELTARAAQTPRNLMPEYLRYEYARRMARLAELVGEAEGDLELIGYYHELFAAWAKAVTSPITTD